MSMLDCYSNLSRPENAMFDDIKYHEYYEQYMVANTLPRTTTTDQVPEHQMYMYQRLRREKICWMNMLYPGSLRYLGKIHE